MPTRSTRSARATPRRFRAARWAAGWKACCSIGATCSRAFSTASTRTSGTRPTDPHLPANYDADTVGQGKPICKAALQKELGLPQEPHAPLVGIVGRLIDQKGFDLVADVMQRWVQTSDVQWVILGTGEPKYHKLLETLAERFPQKVAVRLEFSNPLAHRIEAGADIFLMPSRFEPCGLNQLYSLRYGTVPVVRATGGLADTIIGFDAAIAQSGRPTGSCSRSTVRWRLSETLAPGVRRLSPAGSLEAIDRHRAWRRTGRGPAARSSTSNCIRRRSSEGTQRQLTNARLKCDVQNATCAHWHRIVHFSNLRFCISSR